MQVDKVFIHSNNLHLNHSLKRFCYYNLGIKCSNYNSNSRLKPDSLLFLDETINPSESLVRNVTLANPRIVVFGICGQSGNGYINLFKLLKLSQQVRSEYTGYKKNSNTFLYVKEIEKKVKSFFKGHGEVSLFDLLDNTILSLKNGLSLLCLGNISNTDFKEVYFIPGSLNWLKFKKRFNKYNKYLRVCGFGEEIKQIEGNISKFQEFYERLKYLDLDKLKKMDQKEIDLKFLFLKDIDKKFMNIKNIVDDYSNE